MENYAKHNESIKKLAKLIDGIKIAMLTTVESDGRPHSRPMATMEVEFDGDLWFFSREDSAKTHEVTQDHFASVSYANPSHQVYVTMSGPVKLVHDKNKMAELWSPMLKAYFPDGLDDPHLSLIKVEVDRAEYWDAPSSSLVQAIGYAKAAIAGKPYEGGVAEHEKMSL